MTPTGQVFFIHLMFPAPVEVYGELCAIDWRGVNCSNRCGRRPGRGWQHHYVWEVDGDGWWCLIKCWLNAEQKAYSRCLFLWLHNAELLNWMWCLCFQFVVQFPNLFPCFYCGLVFKWFSFVSPFCVFTCSFFPLYVHCLYLIIPFLPLPITCPTLIHPSCISLSLLLYLVCVYLLS